MITLTSLARTQFASPSFKTKCVAKLRGRGRPSRGRGGYSRYGEGDTKEDVDEQGFSEVLVGEVHMGTGDGDGEEREWVCDSGADFHMTGDIALFESIENITSVFHVKQVQGKVQVTQWGVVLLCTDKADCKGAICGKRHCLRISNHTQIVLKRG